MDQCRQVKVPPARALMLYDGDCQFCTLWIRRWRRITGDAVEYLPYQEPSVAESFPELDHVQLESRVHFICTDGSVSAGAAAVFLALAAKSSPRWPLRWPLGLYRRSPLFARSAELAYRSVATHRTFFSWVTRLLWGPHVELPTYFLTRWMFLRGLGVVYLVAFISLWMQMPGLIGQDGILPATDLMSRAATGLDAQGVGSDRYRLLPTLCWINASEGFLRGQCIAGTVLALVMMLGVAQPVCLALLWLIYLSLATVGRDFFGFQWDNLLLEAGFLAIWMAPFQFRPHRSRERPLPRPMIWLCRLLLFKLMFQSGCVKLLSGDATWHDLTALTYHYETQPLPTWIGWYAHQLPLWIQRGSCWMMFVLELAVPFLIFAPRSPRMLAGAAMILLQIIILVTGNYTFFNWLAILLCLLLLDDFALVRILPRRLTAGYSDVISRGPGPRSLCWRDAAIVPVTILIAGLTLFQSAAMFRYSPGWFRPVAAVYRWIAPLRTVNSYGLFAVMTTRRPEIIVEGSPDGRTWLAYEFKYKPGDLNRRPKFVAPHQPRLDWQMWFAALGNYRQNPWFVEFCYRLLQGSPEVLALLEKNPFPDEPPQFVRARVYDYHFTTLSERRQTGAWWKRELTGEYLPPVSLQMFQRPGRGE